MSIKEFEEWLIKKEVPLDVKKDTLFLLASFKEGRSVEASIIKPKPGIVKVE